MKIRILSAILLGLAGLFISPKNALAVIQNLNGQTGQNQTFQNDSNFSITSLNNVHSLIWQGVLPVSRGGTGTNSFTSGSILFSNGTSITQDNSNLFWDNTNKRLGIGTGSPTSTLNVNGVTTLNGDLFVQNYIKTKDSAGYSDFSIIAGNGLSGATGLNLNLYSGNGDGNGAGGNLSLNGGSGGSAGGGGEVDIYGGIGGGGGGGHVTIYGGDATSDNGSGGNLLFSVGKGDGTGPDGLFLFHSYNGKPGHLNAFDFQTTQDRTFKFPDSTGTLGLLEADQTWSGLNMFEASSNSTIYIGSSVKSGCIALGDSDGNGITYITANDGVLSASSTKPSICQ